MSNIIIHEVGLRDGLQVEKTTVPLEEKLRWIEGLFASGIDIIQLGSFVNPEKVPQMADTDTLFREAAVRKPAGMILSGLVLNERGLERGLACGVEMFCMGVSASETHSRKNTGMSPAEALGRIIPMANQALALARLHRGGLEDGVEVLAVAAVGRHAPGRGVRLREPALIDERRHHGADRRR